jgi:hypothetical protein
MVGRKKKFGKSKVKNRKYFEGKRKVKHYSWCFLVLAFVLLIIFVSIFISEFVSFNFIGDIFEKPHLVDIKDECSLIMGNLVHQVRDETDCNLRCNNECNMEDSKFIESNFTRNGDGVCNRCDCFCK